MTTSTNTKDRFFFTGIPTAAKGLYVPGAVFATSTYYIPVPYMGGESTSIQIIGDGTFVGSWTLRHTDAPTNIDGSAIDPYAAGSAGIWQTDASIGSISVTAASDETRGPRVVFSNQPRRQSQIVLVVSTGGWAYGAASGT